MNIIPVPALILLQVIPFLVTLIALHYILFKPMLAYLDEREAAVEDPTREAQILQDRIVADIALWDARMEAARTEMAQERAQLHQEAQKAGRGVILEARARTEKKVAVALSEIRLSGVECRETLRARTRGLAFQIASRILARPLTDA